MDLKLEHISVTVDNQKIVKDVSLAVATGQFVGMIGPNGSGKSTLLKTVYRVLKPSGGKIFFGGENIQSMRIGALAKNMGVVGQFNNVNFDFTVMEMVLMGRTPHKKMLSTDNEQDRLVALAAIAKVGMTESINRSFLTLSGGEKQRVILARTLTQQPRFLILDEPTNHLDIKYQLQLLGTVKSLGIGILAALHDLNLAAMYCDKLYVLKDGKIVAAGMPADVLTEDLIRDVYNIDCHVDVDLRTKCVSIVYRPLDLVMGCT